MITLQLICKSVETRAVMNALLHRLLFTNNHWLLPSRLREGTKKMRPATAITENKGTTFRRTSKLKIHERKPHHPATITIEMKVWRSISETIPYFSILLIALKNLLENWLFPLFLLHLSLSIQTLTFKTISDTIKQKSFISSYWWMKSDVL